MLAPCPSVSVLVSAYRRSRRSGTTPQRLSCHARAAATISAWVRSGYYLGRAGPRLRSRRAAVGPRLLSRRARAAATIEAGLGRHYYSARLVHGYARISVGLGRGLYLGKAAPRLLSQQGCATPRLLSRRRLRPGRARGRAAAIIHLGVLRGWLLSRLLPRHGQLRHSLYLGLDIVSALRASGLLSARLDFAARSACRLGCCNGTSRLRPYSATAWHSRRQRGQQSCHCAEGAARCVGRDS